MAVLVIAEHDGKLLKPGTANTITAATKLGGDVTVLIAGHQCAEAGAAASKVKGVAKVLVTDAPHYAGWLAENMTALVLTVARNYTHIVAPATGLGKNAKAEVLHHDLDHLAGVWSQEEYEEIMEAVKEQRQIEPEMWK